MKVLLPEFLPPGFLQGLSDDEISVHNIPDPFAKLFENEQLAAEAAVIDKRFAASHRAGEEAALEKAGWNEEIGRSDRLLAKRARTDTTFQKSQNGKWLMEYTQGGELVSGREIQ